MKMRQLIFLFAVLIASLGTSHAQGVRLLKINSFEGYQQALESSRKDSTMLFVVVYGNEGGLTSMFRSGVFNDTNLYNALKPYKKMAMSVHSLMGSRWVELFPHRRLPTFYFLSNDELLLERTGGEKTADDLVKLANSAVKKKDNYSTLTARYASRELSDVDWRVLLSIHKLNFEFEETKSLALEFLNEDPSKERIFSLIIWPITKKYGIDLETRYPEMVVKNAVGISKSEFADFVDRSYSYNMDLVMLNQDSVLLEKVVDVLVANDPDTASRSLLRFTTIKKFAKEFGKFKMIEEAAAQHAKSIVDSLARGEFIFDQAFELADEFNKKESNASARVLARMANEASPNFRFKMLEAYMAYLLEDYTSASELLNLATSYTTDKKNLRKARSLRKMIERATN